MFQTHVNRNYTTGFPGDFQADGPYRGRTARIVSPTQDDDPGHSTNRISRAFGYAGDVGPQALTFSNNVNLVEVGGPIFFGILGNPKRYALQGTADGGSLAPTLDLPYGFEGEFYDMVTGFIAELFNDTTSEKNMTYGDGLAYVPNDTTPASNPYALPFGALLSFSGPTPPLGFIAIPNARVITSQSLAPSAAGSLISTFGIIQLTQ